MEDMKEEKTETTGMCPSFSPESNSDIFNRYIDAYKLAPEADKITHGQSKGKYTVVYMDETDFIVDNSSKVNPQRLIICPSKKSYILADKDGSHDLTLYSLSYIYFFKGPNDYLTLNNRLIGNLTNDMLSTIMYAIKNEKIRNCIELGLSSFKNKATINEDIYQELVDETGDFVKWMCKNTAILSSEKFDESFMRFVRDIFLSYGEEMAKYFAVSFNKASMKINYQDDWYYSKDESKLFSHALIASKNFFEKLNPKRMIDYMLFESYSYGIRLFYINTYFQYIGDVAYMNYHV